MKNTTILGGIPSQRPLLMFPVRVETHFDENRDRLLVRIFPDEILIENNIASLTKAEIEAGKRFWVRWFIASGNKKWEYAAWESLCAAYSLDDAVRISRLCRPGGLDDYRIGGDRFHFRPYSYLDATGRIIDVSDACNEIYSQLDKVRAISPEASGTIDEYLVAQALLRISSILDSISFVFSTSDYVVDYLYDSVAACISYLKGRLDAIAGYYEKHPELKDNPGAFEFRDSDYSALMSLRDRVDAFERNTKDRVIGLEEMIDLYLKRFDEEFFKFVSQSDSDHPSAPEVFLLPDRFVVVAETFPDSNGKTVVLRAEGEDVQAHLPMGLDSEDAERYALDENGTPRIEGNLKWVVDFKEAQRIGMAVTLALPRGCNALQYVYVYGVKTPVRSSWQRDYLKDLFNSHRFYDGGVSLVKTGTPTNEVEGAREVKRPDDAELMRLRYELEVEDAGVDAPGDSDGRLLAKVLGIPFEDGLDRALNLENTEIDDMKQAQYYLWSQYGLAAMAGREPLPEHQYYLNQVAAFLLNYMNPRGIAPVFRIGNRPYGIVSATDFENIHFPVDSLQSIYFRLFLNTVTEVGKRWEKLLEKVPNPETMKGKDAERMFIDMVAQTPRSVSYKAQVYMDSSIQESVSAGNGEVRQLEKMGAFKGRPVKGNAADAEPYFHLKEMVEGLKKEIPHLEDWQAERLLSDFIDQFSFRVDAWFTAFTQYMRSINKDEASRQEPVYGAYGWVFDLERNPRGSVDKGEYILAPSLQHALTAAVLRSAYLTSKSGKYDSHMCINLSSMRVRQALRMLDGIKQGMSTGIILGADLERYLHEAKDQYGIWMDEYIYPLRKLFPQSVNIEAEDTRADNYKMSVINGESLLNSFVNEWNHSGVLSTWLQGKFSDIKQFNKLREETNMSSKAIGVLCKLIERMQDSYDAINDLLLAEGVYRLVAGDKASFAAISNFMSKGTCSLPDPAVLDSPSEYVVVSHKAALALPAAKAANTDKVLACVDPSVTAWLSSIFGNPDNYTFTIVHETAEGRKAYGSSLKQVGISLAEYFYLSTNINVLKNMIDFRWRQATNRFYGTVRVLTGDPAELEDGDSCPRSFSVAMSLYDATLQVDDVRSLLSNGRALRPGDFLPDIESDEEEEKAFDAEEMEMRYLDTLNVVSNAADELEYVVNHAHDSGKIMDEELVFAFEWLDCCVAAGMFDFSRAFDPSLQLSNFHPIADYEEYNKTLDRQAGFMQDMLGCVATLRQKVDEARAIVENAGDHVSVSRYVEAIQALTLKSVKVFPRFRLDSLADGQEMFRITEQLRGYQYFTNLQRDFDMDAWLSDIAEVRPGMECLQNCRQLSFLRYGSAGGRIGIRQPVTEQRKKLVMENSPYDLGEEWLGARVSSEYVLDDADSMMVFDAENAGQDGWYSGFVFDSWLEYIPYRKKTAGMVFRCDQPDSEAPQALLLAIHPECNTKKAIGQWSPETVEKILASTARLAKLRTVSPDVIGENAVSGPFGPLVSTRPMDEKLMSIIGSARNYSADELKELVRKAREEGVLDFSGSGTIPQNLFSGVIYGVK